MDSTSIDMNTLRIDDEANDADTAPSSPFFRLPRELRDEIYDLVALDEQTLYCEITLRADRPPQKTSYAYRFARSTFPNSQFEAEYSAAIERRVKSLVTGHDRDGFFLGGPGPVNAVPTRGEDVKAKEIWLESLEMLKGQQEDGQITQSMDAVMLVVPLMPVRNAAVYNNQCIRITFNPCVVFAFKFPEKAGIGPCRHFDCYWSADVARRGETLLFPSEDDSVLLQVLDIAKEVNWKGSIREYMIWQRYVLGYARRGIAKSS